MNTTRVFLRADGNSKMGLGHVYRSLALAEMINQDFECHFLIRNPIPALKAEIKSICHEIVELPDTNNDLAEARYVSDYILEFNCRDIVVLDGYHFGTAYQQLIKESGSGLICIDDIPQYHFIADAIINHVGGIKAEHYSAESYTAFYLGPEYALLRKPFLNAAAKRDFSNWENATFVCLGGADPNNDTLKVLQKLEVLKETEKVYLVTGAAFKHQESLDEFIKASSLSIQQMSNLSAQEMIKVMAKCPMAICSPSTISYEYLSIGGKLYLNQIADNQDLIKKYLLDNELAFDFSEFPVKDKASVLKLIRQQEKIFSGDNNKNILKVFQNLENEGRMLTS